MDQQEVERERDRSRRDAGVRHPRLAQAGLDRSGRRNHRRTVLSAASSRRSARPRRPSASSPASELDWFTIAARTAALDAICSTARSSSGLWSRWSVTWRPAGCRSPAPRAGASAPPRGSRRASSSTSGVGERLGRATRSITWCSASARRERVDLGRGEQLLAGRLQLGAHAQPAGSSLPLASRRVVRSGRSARDAIRAGQDQQARADDCSARADHGDARARRRAPARGGTGRRTCAGAHASRAIVTFRPTAGRLLPALSALRRGVTGATPGG